LIEVHNLEWLKSLDLSHNISLSTGRQSKSLALRAPPNEMLEPRTVLFSSGSQNLAEK
jgi:hypothetical protein